MILTCPSCGSQFRIAADKLGASGRRVRCSRCKHAWHAMPHDGESEELELGPESETQGPHAPAGDPAPEAGSPEPHGPAADPGAFSRTHRRAMHASNPEPDDKRGAPWGWIAFALVVLVLVAGGWFGRQTIVAQVPQAAALYDMAGVPVNTIAPGLKLRDVSRSRQLADGTSELVIQGRIVNTSERAQQVPTLRAVLLDGSGTKLTSWTFSARGAKLAPGTATTFATRRANPPKEARNLRLNFVASKN